MLMIMIMMWRWKWSKWKIRTGRIKKGKILDNWWTWNRFRTKPRISLVLYNGFYGNSTEIERELLDLNAPIECVSILMLRLFREIQRVGWNVKKKRVSTNSLKLRFGCLVWIRCSKCDRDWSVRLSSTFCCTLLHSVAIRIRIYHNRSCKKNREEEKECKKGIEMDTP